MSDERICHICGQYAQPGACLYCGHDENGVHRDTARAARAEARVAKVQEVLDDAWIRLPPDAEEALKEAIA